MWAITLTPASQFLAVVDQGSFRVEAQIVTPLSGAPPIKGEVDSIGPGIGDTQSPTGSNLLQNVSDGLSILSPA